MTTVAAAGRAVGESWVKVGEANWQKVRRVGMSGVALRLEALLLLRSVRRGLATRQFKEVQAELAGPSGRSRTKREAAVGTAVGVGQAVESAARFVPGARCVAQSLAAQAMLVRRGVPSRIHFGFRRAATGAVEGHAWLEVEGRIVAGDGDLHGFTRTAVFEA